MLFGQDKGKSSNERVVFKNTKVFSVLMCDVGFQYVLCCRMDGKLPKEVHQLMIALVLRVLRYVIVVVICVVYAVL